MRKNVKDESIVEVSEFDKDKMFMISLQKEITKCVNSVEYKNVDIIKVMCNKFSLLYVTFCNISNNILSEKLKWFEV